MTTTPIPPETSFPKSQIRVLLLEKVHPSAHQVFDHEGFRVEALGGALGDDVLRAEVRDVHPGDRLLRRRGSI